MHAPAAQRTPSAAPLATYTDQGATLALYTGTDTPPGNAGDWWLPTYPDTARPHTHDGVSWELAALDPATIPYTLRRDLIALVFAAITAEGDGTGQLGRSCPTVAA